MELSGAEAYTEGTICCVEPPYSPNTVGGSTQSDQRFPFIHLFSFSWSYFCASYIRVTVQDMANGTARNKEKHR